MIQVAYSTFQIFNPIKSILKFVYRHVFYFCYFYDIAGPFFILSCDSYVT
jgi:hypothetical protein